MKRNILYISGTRADYGLMRNTLNLISTDPDLQLSIIATGMHVLPEFGRTISEIIEDGFQPIIIESTIEDDKPGAIPKFLGEFLIQISDVIPKISPDIILILGDRAEMLAGAIAGGYFHIPVAHIHGGERTSTMDDAVRHAISKLSHIHFPASEDSKDRLIKMGEDPQTIFVVGAPGLDQIYSQTPDKRESLLLKYRLNPEESFLLMVQHPVPGEIGNGEYQIIRTLQAIISLNIQSIIIYPNADEGGRSMIKTLSKYGKNPLLHLYPSIPHGDFINLMRYCSVIVGNSSSGIIEAPSFKIPTVNIGSRQRDRMRSDTVIDVPYERDSIYSAIMKAISDENFKNICKESHNPYGDGTTGKKICELLKTVPLSPEMTLKRMTY